MSAHVRFVVDQVALRQVLGVSISVYPCRYDSTGAPGSSIHLRRYANSEIYNGVKWRLKTFTSDNDVWGGCGTLV